MNAEQIQKALADLTPQQKADILHYVLGWHQADCVNKESKESFIGAMIGGLRMVERERDFLNQRMVEAA